MSRLLCFILVTLFVTPGLAGTLVQFRTYWGDVEVELYDQDKPVTVRNFLRYVQSGRYQNSIFHRCPPNPSTGLTDFVVQGGGYHVVNPGTAPALQRISSFGNITNEFGVGRRFSNVLGTIAMAKLSGDTNSASSEWFFNLGDNSFLDAPNTNNFFTVFGHVVRGTNVLQYYLRRSYNNGLQNLGGALSELPVIYSGPGLPTFGELEYVDISLLNVQEKSGSNYSREISWKSVSGKTNTVEYSSFTNAPPRWDIFARTNGNGNTLTVIDGSTNAAKRFYRVRVDY